MALVLESTKMEKEKPYQPSREEREEIEKSRTISDAKFLREGAEYKLDENEGKHLMLDDEQLEKILEDENFDGYCKQLSNQELLELYVFVKEGISDKFSKFDKKFNLINAEIDNRKIDEDMKSKIIKWANREAEEIKIIDAFRENSGSLRHVSPELLNDKNFILRLLKEGRFGRDLNADMTVLNLINIKKLSIDKNWVLEIIPLCHGRIYKQLPKEYRKDKDVIIATLEHDQYIYEGLDKELKKDPDIKEAYKSRRDTRFTM